MENDQPTFDNLFPMRMSSIEKFHWFDDSEEYPNVVFCRMRIAGKLEKKMGRYWYWVQGPRGDQDGSRSFEDWRGTRFEFQEFKSAPENWKFKDHLIESSTGSYLGVFTWPGSPGAPSTDENSATPQTDVDQTEVWLYVHHAVGDGAGSILVINDWMIIYANLKSNRDPQTGLHRLDPKLLAARNSVNFFTWHYLKHLWKQPIALFGAAKFAFRKTPELIPGDHIIGQWIDANQVEQISQHAGQQNVSVNTILLGQLYLILADWRSQQGHHDANDWMRIIMPISIRRVSDRRLPTANRATLVQIDRQSSQASDLATFYYGLNREINIIRGWQLDKIFLLVIRAMSLSDWMLRWAANNQKSRAMAVFTNLGEPLRKSERAGQRDPDKQAPIRPDEFDLVGPIREGTPVNFSVSRYGPAMRVSLQYDSKLISEIQATELLGGYVSRLKSI